MAGSGTGDRVLSRSYRGHHSARWINMLTLRHKGTCAEAEAEEREKRGIGIDHEEIGKERTRPCESNTFTGLGALSPATG